MPVNSKSLNPRGAFNASRHARACNRSASFRAVHSAAETVKDEGGQHAQEFADSTRERAGAVAEEAR